LAARLITVAMAQQDLTDGLADAGTAALSLLPGQQIQLPLLLQLRPHADHQGAMPWSGPGADCSGAEVAHQGEKGMLK